MQAAGGVLPSLVYVTGATPPLKLLLRSTHNSEKHMTAAASCSVTLVTRMEYYYNARR